MVHSNLLFAFALPAIVVRAFPQPHSHNDGLYARRADSHHGLDDHSWLRAKRFTPNSEPDLLASEHILMKRTKETAKKPAAKKQTGESSKAKEAPPKKQTGESSTPKKAAVADKSRDKAQDKPKAKTQQKITQSFKPTNPKPPTKQAKLEKYGFTKETVKKAAPKKTDFVPPKPKSVMGKITDASESKDKKTYKHQLQNVYRVPENTHPSIVKGIDKEAEYMTGTKASQKNFETWQKQRAEPKANRNEAKAKLDAQEKAGFDNAHKKQALTAQLGSAGVAGAVGSLTAAHTGAILRRRGIPVDEDLWMLMLLGEL